MTYPHQRVHITQVEGLGEGAVTGDLLQFDGENWIPITPAELFDQFPQMLVDDDCNILFDDDCNILYSD